MAERTLVGKIPPGGGIFSVWQRRLVVHWKMLRIIVSAFATYETALITWIKFYLSLYLQKVFLLGIITLFPGILGMRTQNLFIERCTSR